MPFGQHLTLHTELSHMPDGPAPSPRAGVVGATNMQQPLCVSGESPPPGSETTANRAVPNPDRGGVQHRTTSTEKRHIADRA